jgi:hypothetical protein
LQSEDAAKTRQEGSEAKRRKGEERELPGEGGEEEEEEEEEERRGEEKKGEEKNPTPIPTSICHPLPLRFCKIEGMSSASPQAVPYQRPSKEVISDSRNSNPQMWQYLHRPPLPPGSVPSR